ncbi:MAG: hypothetical protein KF819_12000 [Labilithrix sp.]|nr:hypothetical protein [Labilithrix sp.]
MSPKIAGALALVLALVSTACASDPDGFARTKPRNAASPSSDEADDEGGDRAPAPGERSDAGPAGPASDGGDAGAPATTSTKGSGGPTGQSELRSPGGLGYILNVPVAAPAKPRGLLVLLHGSGASNYRNFVGMMATVASAHDLIRVSVLAPNGQGWNEGNQTQGAELLHRLIQDEIFTKYDVDLARIVFSGQSSGGGFLSTHFLPLHAKDYRGGAFMQCGAAPPAVTFAPDAATKAGLRLHFEITTGDTIWPTSFKNAVTAYTAAGMTLTKSDTKPGGHCAFDQQQVIVDRIATMLPAP